METVCNWEKLWTQLVEAQLRFWNQKKAKAPGGDVWKKKARGFQKIVERRWATPDSSRQFIAEMLQETPQATIADIGAGTGMWAIFMAGVAASVTAVEPSGGMREVLEENIEAAGVSNISVVPGEWPAAEINEQDFTFASHSMYGCADLRGFVGSMTRVTRNRCFLLLRMPFENGIMADLSRRIWGQPYDSPCFQVAYNALLQMGFQPDVLMETPVNWPGWTNDTMEEAVAETGNRFSLNPESPHMPFIEAVLKERLMEKEGKIVWPAETRSVLVHWQAAEGMTLTV